MRSCPQSFAVHDSSKVISKTRNHLQEPRRKDRRHENFLLQRQAQPPNARHRKHQYRKVRHDIKDTGSLERRIDAEATARRHQRIPDLLARDTYHDLKDGLDKIENEADPDAEVDADVDEEVAFAGGGEDAEVLEQDGEFDEEDDEAVDDG